MTSWRSFCLRSILHSFVGATPKIDPEEPNWCLAVALVFGYADSLPPCFKFQRLQRKVKSLGTCRSLAPYSSMSKMNGCKVLLVTFTISLLVTLFSCANSPLTLLLMKEQASDTLIDTLYHCGFKLCYETERHFRTLRRFIPHPCRTHCLPLWIL